MPYCPECGIRTKGLEMGELCPLCEAKVGKDQAELAAVLRSAELHGIQSEPDMAVGDLRVAMSEAWGIMDRTQHRKLIAALTSLEWWTEP